MLVFEGFPAWCAHRPKPIAQPSWPSPLLQRCIPSRAASSSGCPPIEAPLLGFSKDRPSTGPSTARPLPDGQDHPSARSCHTPNAFRPCRSSRLRRFPPCTTPQVCCTLQPVMGFAAFLATVTRRCIELLRPTAEHSADLPRQRRSHPSEPFPRRQPYRVTTALAFSQFSLVPPQTLKMPKHPATL
jgi:hypothetical protein